MSAEAAVTVEQDKVDKKVLYIKWDVTSDQLKESFSKYGTVSDARVVPTGRIRPFAFVTFASESEAAAAKAAFTGKTLQTQPLTIEYASSAPRGKKNRKQKPAAAAAADGSASSSSAAAKQPAAGSSDAAVKKAPRTRTKKPAAAATDAASPEAGKSE